MACPYDFGTLWTNYPNTTEYTSRDTLYPYLGWGKDAAMMTSKDWENTCAIRLSVCLIRCGMAFAEAPIGALVGHGCADKRLRGKAVVIGFDRLAKMLKKRWGDPKVLPNVTEQDLNNQKGVVAFYGLPSGYRGHIDIIRDTAMPWTFQGSSGDSTSYEFGSGSYFGSREAWFWPSKS